MDGEGSSAQDLEPGFKPALAGKGDDILERGISEFEPWCVAFLADFGVGTASKVQPHLEGIYAAALDGLRSRQSTPKRAEPSPVHHAELPVATEAKATTGLPQLASDGRDTQLSLHPSP
jgi:hypothetical protein